MSLSTGSTADMRPGKDARVLEFENTAKLIDLFGEHDCHLARIENELDVSLMPRGNRVEVEGKHEARRMACRVLTDLYGRLEQGLEVNAADVDGALRLVKGGSPNVATFNKSQQIRTPRKTIIPRSPMQADYIKALKDADLSFGIGPAGTGKTYLAVAQAVSMMADGEIDRIILSRPAVEAGERLGFLPGDLRDKVDPYLRPLYDALYDTMPYDQVNKRLESGEIEVAPLAYMRGRTLSNAFVILDEAQNTTHVQMKMFLTRMGEGSRMAVTGDPSQIDLPSNVRSGLLAAERILKDVRGTAFTYFTDADVVRHPLVSRIVRAYNRFEDQSRRPRAIDQAPLEGERMIDEKSGGDNAAQEPDDQHE